MEYGDLESNSLLMIIRVGIERERYIITAVMSERIAQQ
jgi:hypothetical protein